MATTLRTSDSFPPKRHFRNLPSIIEIKYGIRKYERPLYRFVDIFEVKLYNEAAEFVIKTNGPIPVQGTAPALYIGDMPVINIEQSGHLTYTCRLFEYQHLPDTADIYWGWSQSPQDKVTTRFVFRKKDLRGWNSENFEPSEAVTTLPLGATVGMPGTSRWNQVFNDAALSSAIPLVDGLDIFKNIVDTIRGTIKGDFIYILGWMLDIDFEMIPGDSTSKMGLILYEAAQKGVQIRALIWNNPLYMFKENRIANYVMNGWPKLKSNIDCAMVIDDFTYGSQSAQATVTSIKKMIAGIEKSFEILQLISTGINFNSIPEWVELKNIVSGATDNEGSHHEKLIIVKRENGLTAFCGGADINPDRLVSATAPNMQHHDIQCMVKDSAAWYLLQRFILRWKTNPESAKYPVALRGDAFAKPGPPSRADATISNVKIVHTYNRRGNPSFKDRSVKKAIMAANKNAKTSVYIEDQYMVSLEIADLLNSKLREPKFKKLTILIQSDSVTPELLFPKRKRSEFIDHLYANSVDKTKVSLKMLNPDPKLFPAIRKVHSKFYFIDEELAIIGSANCSLRSLTYDSETSAILFNSSSTSFTDTLKQKLKLHERNWIDYVQNDPNYDDMDEKIIKKLDSLPAKLITGVAGAGLPYQLILKEIKALMPLLRDTAWKFIEPQTP